MSKIAFFDVDETLIRPKSMFSFLRFYLENKRGDDSKVYENFWTEIMNMTSCGASRSTVNKRYYEFWNGEKLADVNDAGLAWFESERQNDYFFIQPTVNALKSHKEAGCLVAMISGSFESPLTPIANYLCVDYILCSQPEVIGGTMTGNIEQPMIGMNKSRAAQKLMEQHDALPQECFAYGDHLSDIYLLEQVGHPRVVANDPELITVATARNWKILQ
ncbi:HAD family hydrolase [Advenella mimigardefordensis]|uniref:HAD family hydrolase n=1 Tax=Advenella mimigardefordensis TaxID=302406 RepID=UPI00046D93BF|nr:HAD-IB family hydrolase [Advenella mimigardefordensis]